MVLVVSISCGGVTTTTSEPALSPFPKPSPSSLETEQESEGSLSPEELDALKTQAIQFIKGNGMGCYFMTLETHQYCIEQVQKGAHAHYYDKALYSYIACDTQSSVYHDPEKADLLTEGLFVNEVYDLLGLPHVMVHAPLGHPVMQHTLFDLYTGYVLDNGKILLIHFVPDFVYAYSEEVLARRIPDYKEEDWNIYLENAIISGLFKLKSAQILDTEEFFAMSFSTDNLLTAKADVEYWYIPEEYCHFTK